VIACARRLAPHRFSTPDRHAAPDPNGSLLTAYQDHEARARFVGAKETRLMRFGATHIVRRAVVAGTASMPELTGKSISPHVFQHSLAMKLLQSSDHPCLAGWDIHKSPRHIATPQPTLR